MAYQIGGAIGVLLDLHDVGKGRVARPEPHQQQVAEADHRGQQIVEIVRHPAGKLADGLHFLRLCELDFEVLLLGDLDEVQHQAAVAAFRPAEPRQKHDAGLVAGVLEPYLDRPRRRRPVGGSGELGGDFAPVVIVQEADQRLTDQILLGGAEQFAERPVCLFQAANPIDQRNADRRVREEPLEALAR